MEFRGFGIGIYLYIYTGWISPIHIWDGFWSWEIADTLLFIMIIRYLGLVIVA